MGTIRSADRHAIAGTSKPRTEAERRTYVRTFARRAAERAARAAADNPTSPVGIPGRPGPGDVVYTVTGDGHCHPA